MSAVYAVLSGCGWLKMLNHSGKSVLVSVHVPLNGATSFTLIFIIGNSIGKCDRHFYYSTITTVSLRFSYKCYLKS